MNGSSHPRVYIFSTFERTEELCVYCWKKLGHNVVVMRGPQPFAEKLREFYSQAYASGDEVVIRTDADLMTFKFDSMLVRMSETGLWWGASYMWCHLRRMFAGGAPHVLTREFISFARNLPLNAYQTMKPESTIWEMKELRDPRRCASLNIITSLHDFEQFLGHVVVKVANRLNRTGSASQLDEPHEVGEEFDIMRALMKEPRARRAGLGWRKWLRASKPRLLGNMDKPPMSLEQLGIVERPPIKTEEIPILYEKYRSMFESYQIQFKDKHGI